jgi:hypothetical protein
MGASNVVAVMASWGTLNATPQRLLIHMAVTALDPPGRDDVPPCLYWAGWETQASAMGYKLNPTSARWLRSLRAQLVAAGAIELDSLGTRAQSTRWTIHPMPAMAQPLPWLEGR